MPNAVVTSNYVGKLALPYVAPAILSADTIANKYVQVRQNVPYKSVLRKMTGVGLQDASCSFSLPASNELTISDVTLETKQLKVNEEICNKELREQWESEMMRSATSAAPGELQSFAGQYIAQRVAEAVELNLWQGDFNIDGGLATSATYTDYPGIMRDIVLNNTGTTANLGGSLTASNIIAKLAVLVGSAPNALKGDPEARIYMSRTAKTLYHQALATTHGPFLNDSVVSMYAGYQIIAAAGFPDDVLLVSRPENLVFGTNLLSDMIQSAFVDLMGTTGSDSTRIVLQFAAGCKVIDQGSLYALYRTT